VIRGRVISPAAAAAATTAQRTAARFQPGQNAHRPGWPVVNQPGTPPITFVPGVRKVASVRRCPSGAPAANRTASRTSRQVARASGPASQPRWPGTRSRG